MGFPNIFKLLTVKDVENDAFVSHQDDPDNDYPMGRRMGTSQEVPKHRLYLPTFKCAEVHTWFHFSAWILQPFEMENLSVKGAPRLIFVGHLFCLQLRLRALLFPRALQIPGFFVLLRSTAESVVSYV